MIVLEVLSWVSQFSFPQAPWFSVGFFNVLQGSFLSHRDISFKLFTSTMDSWELLFLIISSSFFTFCTRRVGIPFVIITSLLLGFPTLKGWSVSLFASSIFFRCSSLRHIYTLGHYFILFRFGIDGIPVGNLRIDFIDGSQNLPCCWDSGTWCCHPWYTRCSGTLLSHCGSKPRYSRCFSRHFQCNIFIINSQ